MFSTAIFDRPIAVLGDVHGCHSHLLSLLEKVGTRPIVVLGDICDRGPDTRGVIETLIARHAIGVRGNHEEWLLAWLRGEGLDDWALRPSFGGRSTLSSYDVRGVRIAELETQAWKIPDKHREWLESLAFVLDLQVMGSKYWLIHAGHPPDNRESIPALAKAHSRELLWNSSHPHTRPAADRTVIMGHVPLLTPFDNGTTIAIDTGAGTLENGTLSALLLPERDFISVSI